MSIKATDFLNPDLNTPHLFRSLGNQTNEEKIGLISDLIEIAGDEWQPYNNRSIAMSVLAFNAGPLGARGSAATANRLSKVLESELNLTVFEQPRSNRWR